MNLTPTAYTAIQGSQPVTLRVKTGEATRTTQLVPHAKMRLSKQEQDEQLNVFTKAVWHLWAAELAGTVPKKGDEIEDGPGGVGGDVWTIMAVEGQTLNSRYRCTCLKQ